MTSQGLDASGMNNSAETCITVGRNSISDHCHVPWTKDKKGP